MKIHQRHLKDRLGNHIHKLTRETMGFFDSSAVERVTGNGTLTMHPIFKISC